MQITHTTALFLAAAEGINLSFLPMDYLIVAAVAVALLCFCVMLALLCRRYQRLKGRMCDNATCNARYLHEPLRHAGITEADAGYFRSMETPEEFGQARGRYRQQRQSQQPPKTNVTGEGRAQSTLTQVPLVRQPARMDLTGDMLPELLRVARPQSAPAPGWQGNFTPQLKTVYQPKHVRMAQPQHLRKIS
jgi:hypothetical protein